MSPLEKRLVLGDLNTGLFNITIWNPLDERLFEVSARTYQPSQNHVISWIRFDNHATAVTPFTTDISAIDHYSETITLETAGKSGSYTYIFEATNQISGITYEGRGTIMIFTKSLPEYGTVGIVIIMFISLLYLCLDPSFKVKRNR